MLRVRAFGAVVMALVWAGWPGLAPAEEGVAGPAGPGAAPAMEVTAGQMQMAPAGAPVAVAPQIPFRATDLAPPRSLRPARRDLWPMPRLRWDDHPRGPRWSAAVMAALRGHGAPLLDTVPRDIDAWCPAYPGADRGQRAAFWAGLISTLAWHESTHRPHAVGGNGRWFGLVQIAPGTARWRNCAVGTGQALLDGVANLRCGVRIMAITVPRDRVVAEGMRGVAADWGPFHSRRKREDMRNWVRSQSYCALPPAARRPEMRPEAQPVRAAAAAPPRPLARPFAATTPDRLAER